MATGYAYDAGLVNRILPRLNQYEATTGRRMTPAMLDALYRAEMAGEVDKAKQSAVLDRQQTQRDQDLALQREKLDKESKAATIGGISDLATTAVMGYLGYKALTKPAVTTITLTNTGASAVPAYSATSAPSVGTAAETTPWLSGSSGVNYGNVAGSGSAVGASAGSGAGAGGAQAAYGGSVATGQGALVAGEGSTASMAAYDAAVAEGAAEGVGSTAGTSAGGASAGMVAYPALAASVGHALGRPVSKALGTHEKTTSDVMATGGGAIAGFYVGAESGSVGGPVGAVIGGVIGLAVGLASDSVICSELLRQARISQRDRTKCVLFRFRCIPDDLFHAYEEWAAPHVAEMRKGGWRNRIRLPFAHAFTNYMLALYNGTEPTLFQRAVWRYAWWRCSMIARRGGSPVMAMEVA